MKKYLRMLASVFWSWLPLGVTITLLCGIIYGAAQQTLRLDAYDPQIQYAEDLSNELNTGAPVDQLSDETKVDVEKSLSPFFIVYDKDGNPVKSTATVGGVTPELPKGVLDNTNKLGYGRFTWEPQKGVRIAAITQKYTSGVVLVGRSLREVEKRTVSLMKKIVVGWFITMLLSYIAVALKKYLRKDSEDRKSLKDLFKRLMFWKKSKKEDSAK